MNPHVLLFSFSKPYNEKIYQHILNSSFIHKLTYKYKKEILDSSEYNFLKHLLKSNRYLN